MMFDYFKDYLSNTTTNPADVPVSRPLPNRPEMVRNTDGGGFVFQLDQWAILRRFLINGAEGNTFYETPKDVTMRNMNIVAKCAQTDFARTLAEIVYVSYGTDADQRSLGPDNKPCVAALTLCLLGLGYSEHPSAFYALERVVRRLPDLYYMVDLLRDVKGVFTTHQNREMHYRASKTIVRLIRQLLVSWATNQENGYNKLERQVVQYGSRVVSKGGTSWSLGQLLSEYHPTSTDPDVNAVFSYATWKDSRAEALPDVSVVTTVDRQQYDVLWEVAFPFLWAYEQLRAETRKARVLNLIHDAKLPWEAVPDQWRDDVDVWMTLLPHMKLGALTRHLAELSRKHVIGAGFPGQSLVLAKLVDDREIKASRLHPLNWVKSWYFYKSGRRLTRFHNVQIWNPDGRILEAMQAGFYKTFATVEPTGRARRLCIDCSASMTWTNLGNVPGFDPRTASAVLAMVALKTDPGTSVIGFSSGAIPIDINPAMSLEEVKQRIARVLAAGTNISAAIEDARLHNQRFGSFEIYTDNEVNGGGHPSAVIQRYREWSGDPNVALIVNAMTSVNFSIADPRDPRMADFPGMGSNTPTLIANFVAGRI